MTTSSPPTTAARAKQRDTASHGYQVIDTPLGAALVATRDIARGERILEIAGRIQDAPTRYSIQLGHDTHIEADRALPDGEMRARHPWRFLNHACEPNAQVLDRTLVARRAIESGAQITFDYTTTEREMAEPFDCHCGSPRCIGTIRGFAHLTAEQRSERAPWLASWLSSWLASSPAPDQSNTHPR